MKTNKTRITTWAMVTMIAALGTIAQANVIHHWTFDSDFTDSEGSTDLVGAGTAAITATSQFGGGAVDIPAASAFVWSGSAAADIDLADDTAWSMSFWLNQGTRGWFAGIGSATTSGLWQDADGDLIVKMNNQANLTFGPDSGVQINGWHHYVVAVDGTDVNNVTVYQDGSSLGTQTMALSRFYFRAIGDVSTSFEFAGQIDEFRIADTALTSTEVSSLYNSNVIPEPATLGLIGFVSVSLLWIRRTFLV